MMEWIYTPADALQWADFSGDDNPIHFDGTLSGSAQRMANSVHGMRALLDVKQALANAWITDSDSDWLYFSARMLEPLRYHQQSRLMIEGKKDRLNGQLVDVTTTKPCISARLQKSTRAQWQTEEALTGHLQRDQLDAGITHCPALDFNGVWQWAFLDAVLFRELLSSNVIAATLRTAFPELQHCSLSALFRQLVVVQTHHETRFHPRIINTAQFFSLDWHIPPALLVGDARTGVVCQLTIAVADQDGPLMSSVVTLKTLPGKESHD